MLIYGILPVFHKYNAAEKFIHFKFSAVLCFYCELKNDYAYKQKKTRPADFFRKPCLFFGLKIICFYFSNEIMIPPFEA